MSRAKSNRMPLAEPGRSAILDANVLRFVRDAIGDPRLMWWKPTSSTAWPTGSRQPGLVLNLLTEKQWAIITQISAKLEAAPVKDLADAAEDQVTLPEVAPVDGLD